MKNEWKPTANLAAIKQRAKLMHTIREFFAKRAVLEVETPLLSQYTATALHIEPIVAMHNPKCLASQQADQALDPRVVNFSCNPLERRFLQSSPEYAMKRLLACGSGDIYQITRSFRSGEIGRHHNPEFSILEWYRIGFSQLELLEEVLELFKLVLKDPYITETISYREIFTQNVNLDPATTSLITLQEFILEHLGLSREFKQLVKNFSKKDCQELLFNHYVEPKLAEPSKLWAIYNYPAEQAALAKIIEDQDGVAVAERFEVYAAGLELANGYHELLDPKLQQARFNLDLLERKKLHKLELDIDPFFMAALEHGLPSCSGVAVGLDRLLMLKIQAKALREVLCFPWNIA